MIFGTAASRTTGDGQTIQEVEIVSSFLHLASIGEEITSPMDEAKPRKGASLHAVAANRLLRTGCGRGRS